MMGTFFSTNSLDLSDLRLKANAELLICGYFREFQTTNHRLIIPLEISTICLDLYYAIDRFSKDLGGTRMEISDDAFSVKHIGSSTASSFGETLIDSINNNTIYKWKFKVTKATLFYGIGITSAFEHVHIRNNHNGKTYLKCRDTLFGHFKYSYFYNGFNGAILKHIDDSLTLHNHNGTKIQGMGPTIKTNDIVEMIFDAGKGHLSFVVNDEVVLGNEQYDGITSSIATVLLDDIHKEEDVKYRMAVSFVGKGDGIEILSFTMEC